MHYKYNLMSTAELRQKLIEKINSISDEKLLLEATRLLEIQLNEIEKPFILSTEMKLAVDQAQQEFRNGDFFSHKEANKEIDEWLEK